MQLQDILRLRTNEGETLNWWQRFNRSSAHTQANIVCSFIVMLATIAYVIVAAYQLHEIKRTNDLTNQAMHASGRAWVGVEKATPISFEKGSDADADSRFLLTVTFTLRNYGHSAAQHVRIFPQLDVADTSTTTAGVCPDSTGGKVYFGDVILPEQQQDTSEGIRITVADMESALKRQNPAMGRNLILSLRGCIEYIDNPSEDKPHHTPFSYFVMRAGAERYFTPDLQIVPGNSITLSPARLNPGPTD